MIDNGMTRFGYLDRANIAVGMENLSKNVAFREKTFNVLYTEIGSNSTYLFQNLVSLGISATSSREISNYIIEKFGAVERKLRLEEEKRQVLQQKNDYQVAKKEFSSLLAKYQSGELIFDSSASGTSAFEYSNLLPESETQLLLNTKRIKISFSKDSLIKFLPAHFNNGNIYLVVSNDGKLLSLESLDKEKIISIVDYPLLNQWIKIDGQFFLTHKDKTFPVSYKCPAMVLETNNYVAENFFYFSIGNKEIEFINDKHIINSDFYNNIPGLEKKTFFIYEKDKIQSQILSLSGAKKISEVKKISNVGNASSIVNAMPNDNGRKAINDNLFRFIDATKKQSNSIRSLISNVDVGISQVKELDKSYALEVFNPYRGKFMKVR
ncbi:MAG: hypothetical protein EOO44_18570 [Flavobacterium sp.]|nr:MAG: hypothetical protein EOO44_18570 [Flavobacterium sp.]